MLGGDGGDGERAGDQVPGGLARREVSRHGDEELGGMLGSQLLGERLGLVLGLRRGKGLAVTNGHDARPRVWLDMYYLTRRVMQEDIAPFRGQGPG